MEVIVRMTKVNPWTGLIKWSNCFDFISSYWTRSGSRYTGLKADKARELEQKMGKAEGELDPDSTFWDTFAIKIGKSSCSLRRWSSSCSWYSRWARCC